jgi:hypothetical protein
LAAIQAADPACEQLVKDVMNLEQLAEVTAAYSRR